MLVKCSRISGVAELIFQTPLLFEGPPFCSAILHILHILHIASKLNSLRIVKTLLSRTAEYINPVSNHMMSRDTSPS
jgi:hypothetical protein